LAPLERQRETTRSLRFQNVTRFCRRHIDTAASPSALGSTSRSITPAMPQRFTYFMFTAEKKDEVIANHGV